MTEMEKRITTAIDEAATEWLRVNVPFCDASYAEVPFEVHARAAIAAMREPTDSMCDAGTEAIVTEIIKDGHWTRGQNADVDLTRRHGRIFWRGMIDAALGSKTK